MAVDRGHRVLLARTDARGRTVTAGGFDLDALFEIGSLTKPVTGLLLCVLVEEGLVDLDDALARFLPRSVAARAPLAAQIRLRDLAVHCAGLPRLPLTLVARGLHTPRNPYAAVTVADLYRALPRRRTPSGFRYSNYGYMLLGHALSVAGGDTYGDLVQRRVLGPLGLGSTSIASPDADPARLVQGHSSRGRPVAPWHFADAAAPAGGLRSAAPDLLRLIEAFLGDAPADLMPALDLAIRPTTAGVTVGGWMQHAGPGGPVLLASGGTSGFGAVAAFQKHRGVGVAALKNQRYDDTLPQLAMGELERR